MPEKISILKESGETLSSNIVSVFMIPDTEKKYIITTENAVDPHGLTVLHVSEIVDGVLQKIASDDEWSSIKTIMRAIISGNVGSYQYLPTIESINGSGQYSRDISVSASASKQMIDNYAAGEKSNVVQQKKVEEPVVPEAPTTSNSIFPSGGTNSNPDDELIPGITEVAAPPVVNPIPPVNQVSSEPVQAVPVNPEPVVVIPTAPSVVSENPTPVVPVDNNVTAVSQNLVQPAPIVEAQPVAVPPVQQPEPVVTDNSVSAAPVLNNDVQDASPVNTENNVSVPTPAVTNVQESTNVVNPVPVIVNTAAVPPVVQPEVQIAQPVQPEVQVVQPSVVVPTAQIAQEAQATVPTPEVKIDTSATPSFNPDASIDQVVVAAQEMFMEGVKNLVQTIQEKVYRDLYLREEEVKKKETLLEQKEKMINEQMMTMMTNFMQGAAMNATATNNPATVTNVVQDKK